MAKTSAVWGIDIGQCALKALRCTLGPDGETIIADKYDFIEYPKILSQPEADPDELIREALELFLSRNDVTGDKVAISVSGQAGLSRFFKPPPVEVKMLPDIVKYEVKQQIPFPIDDVIWDWQQLGGSVVDGRTVDAEVGLFAMKRDAVFRALRPFDDADIDVDFVQLSPLSIFNVVCFDRIENLPSAEEFDPENPPDSVVVMSIGTDTTDLIVTNGIKLWLRSIPIGGNHFTKELSREMKLTQTKAEHLKRNARASENPKAIFKAMRQVFNDLVGEVQRSLTFYQSMEKSAKLSEIVLLGNAAKLPGLRQYLNKQLEIDIAKVTEFQKLEGSEVVTQPTFSNNVLSYAPCYGLCIQALKKSHLNTNLLPEEIVVDRIIRAKKPWVLAAVGLLTLGLVFGLWGKANSWWRVNDQFTDSDGFAWKEVVTKVKSKKTRSSSFVTNDEELKKDLVHLNLIAKELSSASESKATWLGFYSALSQAFPKDARIEKLREESGAYLDASIVGFDDREELYVDYVESAYFKNLNLWYGDIEQANQDMYDRVNAILSGTADDDSVDGPNGPQAPHLDDTSKLAAEALAASGDEEAVGVVPLDKQSGWVIEIKGHHFHNSEKSIGTFNGAKAYVAGTLITELRSKKDVILPTSDPNKEFAYSDIGISFPTIIKTSPQLIKRTIVFDPTATDVGDGSAGPRRKKNNAGGMSGMTSGDVDGGSEGSANKTKEFIDATLRFEVYQYDFVVQMAWTPRTDQEIIAARAARIAEETAEAALEDAVTEDN